MLAKVFVRLLDRSLEIKWNCECSISSLSHAPPPVWQQVQLRVRVPEIYHKLYINIGHSFPKVTGRAAKMPQLIYCFTKCHIVHEDIKSANCVKSSNINHFCMKRSPRILEKYWRPTTCQPRAQGQLYILTWMESVQTSNQDCTVLSCTVQYCACLYWPPVRGGRSTLLRTVTMSSCLCLSYQVFTCSRQP